MDKEIYVVVSKNDKKTKFGSLFDPEGEIVFEAYTRKASFEEAQERAKRLETIYGKCRIARLDFVKDGKKRSGQQLKAYWVLIGLITDYMNEQGNLFSPEEVSSWVKIQANHYHWVGGEKIARSIANKSDATVDDMKKIINFILHFGVEHEIRGCEISNAELDSLLRFYEKN